MKIFICAVCLLFAILFGLLIWTHYDTQRFYQSLPQPPALQTEMKETSSSLNIKTPQHTTEDTVEDTGATVLDTPSPRDFHEHSDPQGHIHPHDNSLVKPTSFFKANGTQPTEETLEALPSAVQLPPGLVHWREWDGEKIVLDRDALIEEFGDTPEVHHYIELSRKIHTADSYTAREIYEHIVLEKQFTQNPNILPSHIESLRQRAAENPDAVIRSWKSMINDPKARIFIQGREWQK